MGTRAVQSSTSELPVVALNALKSHDMSRCCGEAVLLRLDDFDLIFLNVCGTCQK